MKTTFKQSKFLLLGLLLAACSDHSAGVPLHGEVGIAVNPSSIAGNSAGNAGPTTGVSGGPNQTGVTVATSAGIVARITNGLEGNVNPTNGNFSKSLNQVRSNLPKVTNLNTATGYDQAQLLVFAACSDLTVGNNPAMKTVYGVDPKQSATANQSALVGAGMRMLDQHTAGLASGGSASVTVSTVFSTLVANETAAGNSSTIIFMTVCNAANTAGAMMLGL